MLKLVTQPRSRRKREWWRATPGCSGVCSLPPPPAEDPRRSRRKRRVADPRERRGRLSQPREPKRAGRARSKDPTRAHGGRGSRRPSLLWRRLENGLAAVTGTGWTSAGTRACRFGDGWGVARVPTAAPWHPFGVARVPTAARKTTVVTALIVDVCPGSTVDAARPAAAAALPTPSVRRSRVAPSSALPRHARRRRRRLSLRRPRMPPHPDRPTL